MKCPTVKWPCLPAIIPDMGFLETHLNAETMLCSEQMGFDIFHQTVLRYFAFLWHHGPLAHQNMQVTYRATNEMSYTKMILSRTHLNPETVLYPEKMGSQIFHPLVFRYFVFLWHHGPVPQQNMQVTYRATNEMSYSKMTLSPIHSTKHAVSWTHLNPETMLYPEKMRLQIFDRTDFGYLVVLWHHAPVPRQKHASDILSNQ